MTSTMERKDYPQNDVPLGSILLNVVGCVLNVVYRLILLRDQDAHLQSCVS